MKFRHFLLAGVGIAGLGLGMAQPALAKPPQVGSGNEAVIEPPVPHPQETPCTVPLVTGAQFSGFTPAPASFTPPEACPGPWAKVVLSINVAVTAGRQFDRTGTLFLGGVPLWFGTTAEPRATLSPRWHFERDVTDLTALFATAQTGNMLIGNVVNGTYTGVISADASLLFYPPTPAAPAPVTADMVLPLSSGDATVTLNSATDQLITTGVLPKNILSAKLQLFLQGQSGDEFWYTCVPNTVAGELDTCGGGALREGEVTVDGTPAGVAPVFPWIFTGGIDPYLWQPIPGVQTFDFKPFTVDLSPFAGVLSNGQQHSIATSVYGDNGYFSTTGALLLFLDHGAATVTGAVTRNTLAAAPVVTVTDSLNGTSTVTGTVDTVAHHDFVISGTVTGSAGTTTNSVHQTTAFSSDQHFVVSDTQDEQDVKQTTRIAATSTARTGSTVTVTTEALTWPLTVAYNYVVGKTGASHQATTVTQQYLGTETVTAGVNTTYSGSLSNGIQTTDTLYYDAGGNFLGHLAQAETAAFLRNTTSEGCFHRTLAATNNVITAVNTGC